jgi:amino acid transporter
MDPSSDPLSHTFQPTGKQAGYQDKPQESRLPDQPAGVQDPLRPMPVVKVLSPFGVEYVFMTVTLFTSAIALVGVLLSLVNGKTDFAVLALPAAVLVVAVPLFAALFLRLKRLELRLPGLQLDASKRRSTQFIQITAFVVSLLTVIGFVFSIFAKMGGIDSLSIGKSALNCLCVLLVSGGILAYYWLDEHRNRR